MAMSLRKPLVNLKQNIPQMRRNNETITAYLEPEDDGEGDESLFTPDFIEEFAAANEEFIFLTLSPVERVAHVLSSLLEEADIPYCITKYPVERDRLKSLKLNNVRFLCLLDEFNKRVTVYSLQTNAVFLFIEVGIILNSKLNDRQKLSDVISKLFLKRYRMFIQAMKNNKYRPMTMLASDLGAFPGEKVINELLEEVAWSEAENTQK